MEPGAAMRAGAEDRRLAVVSITGRCNNNCVLCPLFAAGPRGRRVDSSPEVIAKEAMGIGASRLAVIGGEPTLHDELPEIVRLLSRGGRSVLLRSNGRRLAYPGYARLLAGAGLRAIEASVQGADARSHDFHTRAPGSFGQTIRGLRAALDSGLEVGVTCAVTRSNFRSLSQLVRLLHSVGVDALHLRVAAPLSPSVVGPAPRLLLAAPHLRRAFDLCLELGIFVAVSGLAPCLHGRPLIPLLEASRGAYSDACEECTARDCCPGLAKSYSERFGRAELAPLRGAGPCPRAQDVDPRAARFIEPVALAELGIMVT